MYVSKIQTWTKADINRLTIKGMKLLKSIKEKPKMDRIRNKKIGENLKIKYWKPN
jgi:hypothetical protein